MSRQAYLRAWIAVIRACEGTDSPDGYRALFGYDPVYRPHLLFTSFDDHPRVKTWEKDDEFVRNGKPDYTTAAGAPQITATSWDDFCRAKGTRRFDPEGQDAYVEWATREKKNAERELEAGDLVGLVEKCGQEWASLPSSRYPQPKRTMAFCRRVWEQALAAEGAAVPAETEPPNPYDPYAPRPPQPSEPGPIFNPDQQAPDFGTAPTQPGDSSMLPALPVVLPILSQLLPMVLQLFAPRAQAQLAKITGQPAEVVQPFVADLFSKAGELVGVVPPKTPIETDAQAVQVLAELQKAKTANAALVQQLETHALDYLDKLAPMFDRLAQADAAANAAAIEGRNAALERALRDPYDVAPAMVADVTTNTRVIGGGLAIGTVAAIVAKGMWPELPDYAAMIIPALTLLAGQISKERGAIIGYRFDGTPQSNSAAAINAAIVEAARRSGPAA